ncbi:MAG: hypothetical protein IPJ13_02165 [Saprospiraceae bacterium]|nr:hypothetical protein [Saprospiraceae bacterium]
MPAEVPVCKSGKTGGGKDTQEPNTLILMLKSLNVWDIDLVAGKNLPDIPEVNNEKYILINEKAFQKISKFGNSKPSNWSKSGLS